MWQAQLQARAFADNAESPIYIRTLKHHEILMMAIVDMCEIQRKFMQKLSDDSMRFYAASSTCDLLMESAKSLFPLVQSALRGAYSRASFISTTGEDSFVAFPPQRQNASPRTQPWRSSPRPSVMTAQVCSHSSTARDVFIFAQQCICVNSAISFRSTINRDQLSAIPWRPTAIHACWGINQERSRLIFRRNRGTDRAIRANCVLRADRAISRGAD